MTDLVVSPWPVLVEKAKFMAILGGCSQPTAKCSNCVALQLCTWGVHSLLQRVVMRHVLKLIWAILFTLYSC